MLYRQDAPETTILPERSRLGSQLSPWLQACRRPPGSTTKAVLVTDPLALGPDALHSLLADASNGSSALVLAVPANSAALADELWRAGGARTGPTTPVHPVRLAAGPGFERLTARLDELPEPYTYLATLQPDDDATAVILTAPVGLSREAVATWRPATNVLLVGFDLLALAGAADDQGLRLLHRLIRLATDGTVPAAPLPGVGMLGYGAIASEHVAGFHAAGFEVVAVCDRSEDRLATASEILPAARVYEKPDELMADPAVGLVTISTPPDTHAAWATAALAAGHHAVVEKPLALTSVEADRVLDAAAAARLTVAVYQNRRFDPDFLALQRLVREGRLGRVFHVEAFVGGYGHPCNYWHSDEGVSGGSAFDWGSHYLDQILSLVPGPVSSVRGSAHKLRWHDVTNADQIRIQLRFEDGTEADFVHSDLAAALKPKWFALGTEGAVVAEWRHERVVGRTDIGLLDEQLLAPADSPAAVWLHHADGSRTRAAVPPIGTGRYHRELADWLAYGEPLTAGAGQSRDVVALLEAAALSAAHGGRAESPQLISR